MLQYKVIRTKYSATEYNQNTVEERLNEAAKEGWQVDRMASAGIGAYVVETYLLSRNILTDEERAKLEETFHTLSTINESAQPERNQMVDWNFKQVFGAEDVTWITLPDDANVQHWAETYNQLRTRLLR